jgi:hypothetical protein
MNTISSAPLLLLSCTFGFAQRLRNRRSLPQPSLLKVALSSERRHSDTSAHPPPRSWQTFGGRGNFGKRLAARSHVHVSFTSSGKVDAASHELQSDSNLEILQQIKKMINVNSFQTVITFFGQKPLPSGVFLDFSGAKDRKLLKAAPFAYVFVLVRFQTRSAILTPRCDVADCGTRRQYARLSVRGVCGRGR